MTDRSLNREPTYNRTKKFVKDLGIYAIGNIGSKLITFLLVPLYTHYVTDTADFGYFDVCLTACFLLMPFLTLQLRDGAFRFLIDAPSDDVRRSVVTFVSRSLTLTLMLGLVVATTLSLLGQINYLWLAFGLFVALSLQEVLSQVVRGLGNNKAFVAIGILTAFGVGVFSLVFVVWLDMGVRGIFLANIVARFLALFIVEMKIRIVVPLITPGLDTRALGREILRYCLPLLPGTLCWWLTGSSDRWFIMHYLGLDANGIYAVAVRFTGVVSTLSLVFYQAWQETSLLQYDSDDRNHFFSQMLNGYIYVLSFIVISYAFVLKICYGWLVAPRYQESLAYIYPMGISMMIFSVAAFFDMGYQCAKDTVRTLPAIVLSAVVNVALNMWLVPKLGIWGAVTTLLVTYLVLVAYRWHDMHRYFELQIYPSTMGYLAVALIGAVPFYLNRAMWQDVLCLVVCALVLIMACPASLREKIFNKMYNKTRVRALKDKYVNRHKDIEK